MNYRQLNAEERSALATLKRLGWSVLEIARELGRHRSTSARERQRNAAPHDGWYRAGRAHERAVARRRRSRRNSQFEQADWERIESLLRCAQKQCRKRYGRHDSRGRLAGKRMIETRAAIVETRRQLGHWEIDTVMGQSLGESSDCILTLVERKSGYVMIGKLRARTVEQASKATVGLMRRHPGKFRTITADNGTEFHGYARIEAGSRVRFYFATPHHRWERGTNENTNGLIRQYLPKGQSMTNLTQSQCDAIAHHLNERPRKRHGYKTPNECFTPH